jgi:hypothetical protein
VQEDGKVSLFSTGEFPCEFVRSWELNAATVMPVLYLEEPAYCIATTGGELLICNSTNFAPVKRFLVQSARMRRAHYDAVYRTILMMYDNQIIRYDTTKGTPRQRVPVGAGRLSRLHSNMLFLGYESGQIATIVVREEDLLVTKSGVQCHLNAVTGFAFGSNYYLSVGLDCCLKVWSFAGVLLSTLELPLPLYGVEILNAKRDIVVGTQSEVMMIPGTVIFRADFEPRDELTDNYNERTDELSHNVMVVADDLIEDSVLIKEEKEPENQNLPFHFPKTSFFARRKKVAAMLPPAVEDDGEEAEEQERTRRIIEEMRNLQAGSVDANDPFERRRREKEEQAAEKAAAEAKKLAEEAAAQKQAEDAAAAKPEKGRHRGRHHKTKVEEPALGPAPVEGEKQTPVGRQDAKANTLPARFTLLDLENEAGPEAAPSIQGQQDEGGLLGSGREVEPRWGPGAPNDDEDATTARTGGGRARKPKGKRGGKDDDFGFVIPTSFKNKATNPGGDADPAAAGHASTFPVGQFPVARPGAGKAGIGDYPKAQQITGAFAGRDLAPTGQFAPGDSSGGGFVTGDSSDARFVAEGSEDRRFVERGFAGGRFVSVGQFSAGETGRHGGGVRYLNCQFP